MSNFVQQNAVKNSFQTNVSWVILSSLEKRIKQKIERMGKPLKDWDIRINYGIKTGYNEAFIVSTEKRYEILNSCRTTDERKKTDEIIRPILRGRDIRRYSYEWAGLWLINTHNGVKGKFDKIDIENFPAIKKHLDKFWERIKDRTDQGDTPYNLRNCAYMEDFLRPKIIYPNMTKFLPFVYDEGGYYTNQKCFFLVT